jgi:hypothetical protein
MLFSKKRTHSSVYRKIYEDHHGPIPQDHLGRSFDIHHRDGNDLNNSPNNLVALSIEDHYSAHLAQGDIGACNLIARRMNMSKEELSDLARLQNQSALLNGKHSLMTRSDGSSLSSDRVKSGTHHLLKRSDGTSLSSDRVLAGTHHLLRRPDGSSHATDRVLVGTHHLLGANNPRYDSTIYVFENTKNNEIMISTRSDFVKRHGVDEASVSKVISGVRKTCGGWRISISTA